MKTPGQISVEINKRGVSESSMAGSGADAVVDELKRNAPQDLAMLSAGLSEIRHLLGV